MNMQHLQEAWPSAGAQWQLSQPCALPSQGARPVGEDSGQAAAGEIT